MKKILTFATILGLILTLSGCGDSPRSIEDLQKLSKAELKSMGEECLGFYYGTGFKSKKEAEEQWGEIEKIAANISQFRGKELRSAKSFSYKSVTDDEFAKFGNGNEFFKKIIECGRLPK
ncbi:hypothetical protein [Helicobacter fennelliae]|uniref:Lipoprotein n=1 Tax=Helicobacter fennelliae MRY12-0050 TaxID=1325130 RepID=T1DX70_9HELI|nr:hypothetical protein [Helicobacter fennelliae]GAD19997.1 hypothetical protein HFN_1241 [Helicobacter fennelliae MRY12-0050]STP07718.1 Uncharacterised protein [Helicobacter fennelliae]